MRRASAICWVAGSSGWQQMKSSRRMSSRYSAPSSRSTTALFGVVEIGDHLVGRNGACFRRRRSVDGGVAPDEDQPGGRIARRALLGPGPQRPEARLLEGFLGRVEIAEIAQQGADGLGPGRAQRRVDPGHVGRSSLTCVRLPLLCPAGFPGGICRRADLIGAAGIGPAKLPGHIQRLVESGAVDT